MDSPIKFTIEKKADDRILARAGTLETSHGIIETPTFAVVGTKATVKAITPEQLRELGGEVMLANTYHLHLRPGSEVVKKAGGLHKFAGWDGPMMTDSGGFQVFSLGEAFGKGITKITSHKEVLEEVFDKGRPEPVAKITEDGVHFKSYIDGHNEYLTPEKSIEIQHNLGADIIFAFDECTSPHASYEYQKE